MKKKFVLIVLVFAFVSFNLYAQSNEQRLVGTWTNLQYEGVSVTFNSNGTMSGEGIYSSRTHWAAAGDTLILFLMNSRNTGERHRFQISNDGRTLIIGDFVFRRNS